MKNFPKNVKTSGYRAVSARIAVALIVLLLCGCFLFFACKKDKADKYYAEVSEDFKTEYYVGDAFVADGNLKTYLAEDYFELIPITEDMVTGFDTTEAKTLILTVTYGKYVAQVPIRVLALTARSLTVNEETLPDVIYKDKGFPSGVTMSVTLSNGSTEVVAVTAEMLGSFNAALVGTQTVQISYRGASTLVSINVAEDYRKSIELMGAKTEYSVGEALYTEEVYVKVRYAGGGETTTAFTADLVPDFTTAKGKEYKVQVKYKNLTCDYAYSVQKKPRSFKLNEASLPSTYEIGDPFPSGGTGVLTYDDDTTETVTLTGANAPAFDTTVAAEQKTVKIVVSGCEDDYGYTVLRGVESMTVYGYTAAVRQGELFDGFGELIVVYEGPEESSERTEYIPLISDNAKRENLSESGGGILQRITTDRLHIEFRTSAAGQEVVQKVYYRKWDAEFKVIVFGKNEDENTVESLSLSGTFPPIVCGDEIVVDYMQVTTYYKYKKPETSTCLSEWINVEGGMPATVEGDFTEVTVSVTRAGVTAEETRKIKVLSQAYAATVTSFVVRGMPSLFSVGDELTLDKVSLYVTYGGGYRSEVVAGGLAEVQGFDTATAGEKTMKVLYGGVAPAEIAYRVITEEEKTLVTALSLQDFSPLLFVGDTVAAVDRTRAPNLSVVYGYDNDHPKIVPLSDENVILLGGPFTEAGEWTVTVTYKGFPLEKTVTVYPAEDKTTLTDIAVTDTVRSEVGTAPNLSAWNLTLIYGHGFKKETIPLSAASVSECSIDSVGYRVVTVTYRGLTCQAHLYFAAGGSDNVLQGLSLSVDSRRVFEVGESISGVKLIAEYNTKRVPVEVSAAMAKASGFTTAEEGKYEITISYGDRTVLFTYTVVTELPDEDQ